MSKDLAVVAKRYALALFDIAGTENLEKTADELRLVKSVISSNKDLMKVLAHPKVTTSQKKELVKDSIGAELSTPVMNTLFLLVDRNRISLIGEMADQFINLANDAQGVADAKVYSVRPLSADETAELEKTFTARLGKKLRIENIIEPSLIGGMKIRIGNRIFDGSVSGKLDRIERQLASVRS
ncbi:F0F1 ATP synthase subunit delta [Fictibacillus iocasae]|uniref:ATP synthase subunit delta n=1 Tax=Fictibacillus iocasae TaxID=2715437 RepID=A0ABW2NRD1_9BACL